MDIIIEKSKLFETAHLMVQDLYKVKEKPEGVVAFGLRSTNYA